ncbi:MAG: hypothetical protein ACR2QK_06535 [Acidimicrobiales bacterium]
MTNSDIDARLDRQEQIWGGLYGPPRARELVEEARARLAAEPTATVDSVLLALEPPDDIDADEAGTMRPI